MVKIWKKQKNETKKPINQNLKLKIEKIWKNRKVEPKIQKPKLETEVEGDITSDATADINNVSVGQGYCILHKMSEDSKPGICEILSSPDNGNTGISENSLEKSTPNPTHPN